MWTWSFLLSSTSLHLLSLSPPGLMTWQESPPTTLFRYGEHWRPLDREPKKPPLPPPPPTAPPSTTDSNNTTTHPTNSLTQRWQEASHIQQGTSQVRYICCTLRCILVYMGVMWSAAQIRCNRSLLLLQLMNLLVFHLAGIYFSQNLIKKKKDVVRLNWKYILRKKGLLIFILENHRGTERLACKLTYHTWESKCENASFQPLQVCFNGIDISFCCFWGFSQFKKNWTRTLG